MRALWKDIDTDKEKKRITLSDLTTLIEGANLARQIAFNAVNASLLSRSLNDVCPLFFSSGDLILNEAIKAQDKEERANKLKLCAKKWTEELLVNEVSLAIAAFSLVSRQYYGSVIDLCLDCASCVANGEVCMSICPHSIVYT